MLSGLLAEANEAVARLLKVTSDDSAVAYFEVSSREYALKIAPPVTPAPYTYYATTCVKWPSTLARVDVLYKFVNSMNAKTGETIELPEIIGAHLTVYGPKSMLHSRRHRTFAQLALDLQNIKGEYAAKRV